MKIKLNPDKEVRTPSARGSSEPADIAPADENGQRRQNVCVRSSRIRLPTLTLRASATVCSTTSPCGTEADNRDVKKSRLKKGAFIMAELKITAENFENEVLHSEKPVLLDFYADWCGPCKMLAPVLHELAEEKADSLKVGKINVDEQTELAMRFGVSSIPMLAVIKDGKIVSKSVGYRPKADIAAMIDGIK